MISTYLMKSVEGRDIKGIRGALKGIIDSDPAFISAGGGICEFDEAVSFILRRGIQEHELFDAHDDQYLQEDRREMWTREYYFKVLNYLSHNFSRERIDHLKEVGRAVMADDKVYREKSAAIPPKGEKKKEVPLHKEQDTIQTTGSKGKKGSIVPVMLIIAAVCLLLLLARLFWRM